MLPNAPKIPSCNFIWKRRISSGPSRLYLVTQYYGKGGYLKQRNSRLGFNYRHYSEQGPCPKPQPPICDPPKPRKLPGFGTTFAILGIGTAAVVAYAKYDCDFRKVIEEKAPLFDEFIKITTQEEHTYAESWERLVAYISSWFDFSSSSSSTEKKQGFDPKKGPPCPPPEEIEYEAPKSAFEPLLEDMPETNGDKGASKYNEIRVLDPPSPEIPMPDPIIIEDTQRPEIDLSELPEFHPKSLVDLEKSIGDAAKDSILAYHKAVCALRDHSESVYELLETKIDRVDPEFWNTLKEKTMEKDKVISDAEAAVSAASEQIDKLSGILDDPAFTAPESFKTQARRNITKVRLDMERAKRELLLEGERTSITDKYWQKVEQARRYFQDELEILFPSVKIDEKKMNIKPQELDLLLVHAYTHVLYYQKELSKLETIGEQRIKEAIEKENVEIDDCLLEERVNQEVEKQKRELFEDLQKKMLSIKADQDRDIKDQMKKQLEAAEDYIQDAMEAKQKEMDRKLQRKIDEQIEIERQAYKEKLAKMVGRMQGVEAALQSRLLTDRLATQAQALFACCQSLLRALRAGKPGSHYSKGLRPLEAEISAIERASADADPLVSAVLRAIPDEARKRGVYPEMALRERFLKVERTARRLALIPDEGASLPRYLISFLQSFLLFRPVNPIPAAELEDEPVNLTKLDTYDILERARYWLDRGDFSMSLKYMNLLKGAPRQVSCEWMNETRIFLETQQAADALLAYAAATGQQYT